ncbi:MAG: T9SS type A sorting domain-containing protein [bacterium]|nr:T9SS type A sorting domain-containing protein [bacterium]
MPLKIIETYDNGLVFPVYNTDVFKDLFLYKLDVNGNLLWKRNYYINNSSFETTTIIKLQSGGYLLGGATTFTDSINGDAFIIKMSDCFEPIWFKIYNEKDNYNRIDEIIEYGDKLLVSFAYLKENFMTIALLDKNGKLIKKNTLPEISYSSMSITQKNTINIISDSYPTGLLNNPNIGINKSILFNLDSNLNIVKFKYYFLQDTNFFNSSYKLCYTNKSSNDFLTLSNNRVPNSQNVDIDGSIMITKNLDENNWRKVISDTNKFNAGTGMLRLNENRFIITSNYNPDLINVSLYYGKNYIIDSFANIIYTQFENIGTKTSETKDVIKLFDNNIVTIGTKNTSGSNWAIYCYKYNPDLTPFLKTNIIKQYDSMCSQTISTGSLKLPNPMIVPMILDSFLRIRNTNFTEFEVYPNPVSNILYFKSQNKISRNLNIKIFDTQGKIVFAETIVSENGVARFNLVGIPNGQYLVYIEDSNSFVYRPIIILNKD